MTFYTGLKFSISGSHPSETLQSLLKPDHVLNYCPTANFSCGGIYLPPVTHTQLGSTSQGQVTLPLRDKVSITDYCCTMKILNMCYQTSCVSHGPQGMETLCKVPALLSLCSSQPSPAAVGKGKGYNWGMLLTPSQCNSLCRAMQWRKSPVTEVQEESGQ